MDGVSLKSHYILLVQQVSMRTWSRAHVWQKLHECMESARATLPCGCLHAATRLCRKWLLFSLLLSTSAACELTLLAASSACHAGCCMFTCLVMHTHASLGLHITLMSCLQVFNIFTVVVKFASCALAVASGLPVGPEGPMIHIGAALGAALSQGHSTTLGFSTKIFRRFRNPKDKRDFVTAGVAVGVATAFNAPIGGLLFAFEEVASFWQHSLGWQVGCVVTARAA